MARIAGVDLPAKKRAEIGLTYIYGIGRTRSKSILHRAGINFDKKIGELTEDEVNHIRTIIEAEGSVEGDLELKGDEGLYRGQLRMDRAAARGIKQRGCIASVHDVEEVIRTLAGYSSEHRTSVARFN